MWPFTLETQNNGQVFEKKHAWSFIVENMRPFISVQRWRKLKWLSNRCKVTINAMHISEVKTGLNADLHALSGCGILISWRQMTCSFRVHPISLMTSTRKSHCLAHTLTCTCCVPYSAVHYDYTWQLSQVTHCIVSLFYLRFPLAHPVGLMVAGRGSEVKEAWLMKTWLLTQTHKHPEPLSCSPRGTVCGLAPNNPLLSHNNARVPP